MAARSLLVIGLSVVASVTNGQTGDAAPSFESFADALQKAVATHPSLREQQERLHQTEDQVSEARRRSFPTLSVSGDIGRARRSAIYGPKFPEFDATSYLDQHDISVALSQPLYRGGRNSAQLAGSLSAASAERERFRKAEQTVLLSAAKAYLDLRREVEGETLKRASVNRLEQRLRRVQGQLESGQATRTDVAQARGRVASSSADLAVTRGRLRAAVASYEEWIGPAPNRMERPVLSIPLPGSLDEVLAAVDSANIDVLISEQEEQSARFAADEARGRLKPTIDLSLEYSHNFGQYVETRHSLSPSALTGYVALFKVSVPLFQPMLYAQVSAARHAHSRATQATEGRRRTAASKAASGWARLQAATAVLQSARDAAAALEQANIGLSEEQAAGTRSVVEVLDGERELFAAQVAVLDAEYEIDLAQIQLAEALGALSLENIQ